MIQCCASLEIKQNEPSCAQQRLDKHLQTHIYTIHSLTNTRMNLSVRRPSRHQTCLVCCRVSAVLSLTLGDFSLLLGNIINWQPHNDVTVQITYFINLLCLRHLPLLMLACLLQQTLLSNASVFYSNLI